VIEEDDITQPGSIKMISDEGMPIMDSSEKGNLYVQFQVKIPNFSGEELDTLEDFFNKRS
jgi:DnaJ-class molecular chaperone